MSSGKILLGVLAGIAVGATLGILFAPDKGSKTRKKIREKGDEYADELGEKFNDFISSVSEQFEKVKEETTRIAKKGKRKAEETVDAIDGAI